jgi:hypothetical protein
MRELHEKTTSPVHSRGGMDCSPFINFGTSTKDSANNNNCLTGNKSKRNKPENSLRNIINEKMLKSKKDSVEGAVKTGFIEQTHHAKAHDMTTKTSLKTTSINDITVDP